MKALIIANGSLPRRNIVRSLISSCEMIICADGGANHARRLRITPNIILGDLDSITSSTRKYFSRIPLMFIDDQYSTDLEKALTYCIERNIGSADVIGGFGDRIDHTSGGLGCFKRFGDKLHLRLFDAHGFVSPVGKKLSLNTRKGQKLSLIPLERCTGVTTSHLKYNLDNDVLELGVQEGISNEATASPVRIHVKKGTLLLYQFY